MEILAFFAGVLVTLAVLIPLWGATGYLGELASSAKRIADALEYEPADEPADER